MVNNMTLLEISLQSLSIALGLLSICLFALLQKNWGIIDVLRSVNKSMANQLAQVDHTIIWISLSSAKPKPGRKFIGRSSDGGWHMFTCPNHDILNEHKKVETTKEEHFAKIVKAFDLLDWMYVP